MSGEKATSPCSKFQANIFNKSKCQNCFKSRELHLLNDRDMAQAKPIYGGWLCLAPEGTDFDNPMQRSRKWQRRFFILYEHGSLSFALDELPSTLPQGTLNMNHCTDITDAEPRTGQRNALCIVTPEQDIFIRGDSKEIMNGWSEQLSVYLRNNKQNLKKKRKVEPVATQEPSPAKMAATDPSFPLLESSTVSSHHGQEDQLSGRPDVTSAWTVTDPPGLEQTPADKSSACLISASKEHLTLNGGSSFRVVDLPADKTSGGNKHLAKLNNIHTSANENDQHKSTDSTAEQSLGSDGAGKEQDDGAAASRMGRSEARTLNREKLQSCGDLSQLSVPHPHRRAKSLDGRTSDNVMTPDLLNFKKGWMVKLDENDQWKKYWFVLSTDSLRYYKDSVAEEASHVEGEIDLTKCYNVSEYQVQRNYGFQIHTSKAVFTLSAMTAGIRRNWIQALMKNVHPANAPDVASLPGHHVPCCSSEALPKPDVTQDSPSTDVPTERDSHLKPRSVTDRRREGRYKTFDWADFRAQNKPTLETDPQRTKPPCSLEVGNLERRKRREERRRRYENMLGFSLSWDEKAEGGSARALSPTSQQIVEEDIEECWKQVEKTVFRLERAVPLYTETKDNTETEELLDSYRKWVEELKAKLVESEHRVLELEAQLASVGQQLDPSLIVEADICPWDANERSSNSQTLSAKDVYEETSELLQQQNLTEQQLDFSSPLLTPHTPSIWLRDTEGNFQDLEHLLPDSVATSLLSLSSDNQDLLSPADGQAVELNLNVAKSAHKDQLDKEDSELILTSEGQINNGFSSGSLILPPDQAAVKRLSQEVELLSGQNQALNQRNQEMLNQLTEADREIERLKAELSSRYTDCTHHLPEVEQQGKLRVEDLQRELSLRNQELLEAQTLITSLEESLRETEALLQMNVPAATEVKGEVKSDGATKAEEYLLLCFEATEAKLTELERQLNQSERTCRELQLQNSELKEAEKRYCQRAADVDADTSRSNQGLEEPRTKQRNKRVSAEERIQQVIGGMVVRLEAWRKLLEVIDRLDFEEHEEEPTVESQVMWETVFWSILLSELQTSPSQSHEEKPVETLLSEVTEHVIVEKQVLLLGHGLRHDRNDEHKSEALKDLDIIRSNASLTGTEMKRPEEKERPGLNHRGWDIKHFRAMTQMKISLLNHITSSVETPAPEELQLMADRLYDFYFSDNPWCGFIHSAATEALYCWRLSRLHSKYEQEREETKHRLIALSLNCSNCVKLMQENRELEGRMQASLSDTCCQTEETCRQDVDTELQIAKEGAADEIREGNVQQTFQTTEDCMEILLPDDEGHLGIQEILEENTLRSDDIHTETVAGEEMDHVSVLRRRVEELEELLSVIPEEMKEDFDEQMSSVQTQHKKEVERVKATCQHGLASMEESHLKVVEELQRRHQQEVERLLMERDRLLEEESAATATAIEAIKNAHCLELERELQKRCQSENSSNNTDLQDIYRQHGEEVASYQRELEVLSQQFSLKCLENGHLVQALDAERKALCQCQQENQDLRTRNQELSSHLAAEITRLCSLAKQDDLPLSQGMDVYEMEITLRVKESEVQCLKQVITSLKEELQSAQRDKRNATKRFKDMYTELSIVRAKAERETGELRENLRLAHQALGQTSP